MTTGKEKVATVKKSRGRQTTSTHAPVDTGSSSSYTRRKVAEIRKDIRGAKIDRSAALPHLDDSERYGREYDGEIEVARTEPCSPALSARVMAAAGHGESTWMFGGWNHGQEEDLAQMQAGPHGATVGDLSIPMEPRLPYPLVSPIWPNLPPQIHPEATPTRMRTIEGPLSHSVRTQSPVPRPLRPQPQPLQTQYSPPLRSPLSVTHSAPSTVSPPPSATSTSFTPPRPSIPAGSTSWGQYPAVPFTEQAVPACALGPEPPVQPFQAQGYFAYYPDSNRTSGPRTRRSPVYYYY